VFSYLPEDVAVGDYTLKIGLGEGGSFAQAYALLRFRAAAPAGTKVSGGS
jgi:hypothetical protein